MKLKDFYILWSTQSISQLGSAMTEFALTLWLYDRTGSALSTALLTICSYVPYVLVSIFAGALTDRLDKKRTMLICDAIAASTTVLVFVMLKLDMLAVWHLYAINALSGLMNTVQQPASEVALTLIIPDEEYQKTSGLMSFSRSAISILNPLLAAALYSFWGMNLVIAADLGSFLLAFVALAFWIRIPKAEIKGNVPLGELVKEGLGFLKRNPMILTLIFFMAGVNLVASAFDAVLPAFVLPNPRGGANMLGIVTSCSGAAMIVGSLIASVLPKPKDRIRVVYLTMLFSLGIENFLLAFSRSPILWCIGQVIGWILVPVMSSNLDVIMRTSIPVELQGRVYACRNTLQYFTIPIGLFAGGFLVDEIFEPLMDSVAQESVLAHVFGFGKGSGAAVVMAVLGISGITVCLITGYRLKKYYFNEV
ncbi:MAG: MFS transporter [Acetatifactor sp.]|nr:MFS transporter [Acetatifactor sp.]